MKYLKTSYVRSELKLSDIRRILFMYFNNRSTEDELILIDSWYRLLREDYDNRNVHNTSLEMKIWNKISKTKPTKSEQQSINVFNNDGLSQYNLSAC